MPESRSSSNPRRRSGEDTRRNAQGRQHPRGGQRNFSRSAPAQRPRSVDPARTVAFNALNAVSVNDAYANLILPSLIRRHRLDKRDAGFATELTYGTLRAQGLYDAILQKNVDRDLSQLEPAVLDILRMGAHQILAMRVPTHAALNETVALAREQAGIGASGLVNAVLRKVSEKTQDEWLSELEAQTTSEIDRLALQHAHPAWIVRAFRQALVAHGRDERELEDLLRADNEAPEVNLVALPGLGDLRGALAEGAEESDLVKDAASFHGGDIARLPGVKDGTVRAQDVGSQLVARALAHAVVNTGEEHEQWLDMCAGPGGKAALLASLAAEAGHHVQANEPTEHRAQLVRQSLEPIPSQVWEVSEEEGQSFGEQTPEKFDRILVDAPCTGLGALRRRPESRWRRQPSDVGNLIPLQTELLSSAVKALKPGGVVAYVTCSPHYAETDVVVNDVMEKYGNELGLHLLDAPAAINEVSLHEDIDAGAGKTAQLWPHLHHSDAMFLALIGRDPKPEQEAEET